MKTPKEMTEAPARARGLVGPSEARTLGASLARRLTARSSFGPIDRARSFTARWLPEGELWDAQVPEDRPLLGEVNDQWRMRTC